MIADFLRGLRMLRHPELVRRLGDLWSREKDLDELRRRNPRAQISPDARIEGWRRGGFSLGEGSRIELGTIVTLGDEHNGFGSLSIGSSTWIGPYNNLRLAGGTSITIGNGCLISQFCTLVSANHSLARSVPIRSSPCTTTPRDVVLGDDVWLGAGVILLPGVSIGTGAVIGAGSVVTADVPDYEIHAGNPARRVGERRD